MGKTVVTVEKYLAQQRRIEDLEDSLKAIGRILVDESNTQQRRIDRVLGVLDLWNCAPQKSAQEANGR